MASLFSTPISRRQLTIASGSAALFAALASLGMAPTPRAAQASEAGSTFVYALAGDPGSGFNPFTTSDRYGLTTLETIYSPLFTVEVDGSLTYFLATGFDESDDRLTYTVHLRDDADVEKC